MHYLTTHDAELGETKTRHFATRLLLHDAVKDFIRQALDDDEAFDELIQAHLAEAATWTSPDDELQALVDKFEELLSGDCPDIIWGEVGPDGEQGTHEIHRLLTVSTGHVTKAVRHRLMDPDGPLPMLATDGHGAWLRTGLGRPDDELPEEEAQSTVEWGPELTAVLAYARGLGCAYVRLDGDGPEYPDLPTFD